MNKIKIRVESENEKKDKEYEVIKIKKELVDEMKRILKTTSNILTFNKMYEVVKAANEMGILEVE